MLINNKVLIKLQEHQEHTKNDSGIMIPLYERTTTDGDRPTVKISSKTYLSKGIVVDVAPSANAELAKDNVQLKAGDEVFVNVNAVSPSYQYFTNRDSLVISFDGHILIPYTLIDAIHPK